MKLHCNKTCPPLGGIITAQYLNCTQSAQVEIIWETETYIENGKNKISCDTTSNVSRVIARQFAEKDLYGTNPIEKAEVDSWLTFVLEPLTNNNINSVVLFLDKVLTPTTYLVGKRVTIADFAVFAFLHASDGWHSTVSKNQSPTSVLRWFNHIKQFDGVRKALDSLPSDVKDTLKRPSNDGSERPAVRPQEGKFIDLPGAEMGKVVVRFPPEASGYLHIGHAKAALLNQYYQQAFNGKLIMRFDDTNPAKENVEFEKVILEDLEMLEIKPDMFTHTSNYFDLMLSYCEQLLKEEKAYVDDTDPETMKQQREQRQESANRSNSVDKNLQLWEEMKKGTSKGQKCCVRAKIDMQSANGCMRDPTIYRCKNEPHPRTGDKYKVYPTYDFACPIVDSIEGVTHTLRTMEYHDRDPQFYWFIDALRLRKPHIWEYSRLSMTHTVLSKRKLTWFVDNKLVDGWDDPRFPTVRGVLRRGMTVEGLKQFIIAQGSSRSVVFMEWDKIWAFNKKVIDPIAPRYTALEYGNTIPVTVKGVKEEKLTVPCHPKNPDVGVKDVWIGPNVLVDLADAQLFKSGDNVTFINWGNLLITKINRDENQQIVSVEAEPNLDNKDYKKTLKVTWLAEVKNKKYSLTPTWCVYFDNIISKAVLGKDEDFKQFIATNTRQEVRMLGDPELKKLKHGDIIQLQRRGFFKVDFPYYPFSPNIGTDTAIALFSIPDGHTKENPTAGLPKSTQVVKKPVQIQSNAVAEKGPQSADDINKQITLVGDKIRKLKADKVAKSIIDVEVKTLLALKADYKKVAGVDWKPGTLPSTPKPSTGGLDEINQKIVAQGDKIRKLKSEKVAKNVIEPEVALLLALKAEYKQVSGGNEWKPGAVVATPTHSTNAQDESTLLNRINEQGNKVRQMKGDKVDKSLIDVEVKLLLSYKQEFQKVTGKEWKPGMQPQAQAPAHAQTPNTIINSNATANEKDAITQRVNEQGDLVRKLKSEKATKETIDQAVKTLLELKADYKKLTGTDFPSAGKAPVKSAKKTENPPQKTITKEVGNIAKKKPVKESEDGAGVKKQTRLGLEAKKEENLSDWYSQVITKGELIEYYDVSGCYIFRPWSFAIWEAIKEWFDTEIKKLGVQNCYFPIFVSRNALEKEKTHISDFAPEVAWVTRSGDSEMAEPVAVRPTSETVMYPAYAKWIQSYRDLPIKLNQWNNVVRWEFKHPQPFLRTREFLWQEGHTAHAHKTDATDEVKTILDLYAQVYTDLLAIPVVKGRKTEKEKFAGAEYTLTTEAFVSISGRGIQGATSHHLAQNFSKMFEIVYDDPETQEKRYVFQNSWGLTTRTIGVMIMVHGDNRGLVLPPRVASVQVVIVPCGLTVSLSDDEKNALQLSCDSLESELNAAQIRVKGDYRINYSPGWKFNHWELKGVPIRVELGPKDIKNKQLVAVRRDTGEKLVLNRTNAAEELKNMLESIQRALFDKANEDLKSHIVTLNDWDKFTTTLDNKNIILAPFCGESTCEDRIKADSARDEDTEPGAPSMGAKSLCIPIDEYAVAVKPSDRCIHPQCKKPAAFYTLFGRSY